MNSFKTANGFVKDIWGLPVSWQFQNWIDAFELTIPNVNVTFAGMYLNTLFFVVVNVSLNMFFNAISAYVVAKYEFKAMKVIYSIALIFFVVPMFGSIATLYKFLVDVKLYDTYAGIVLISLQFFKLTFLFLYAFLQKSFMDVRRSRFIDGAGHFKVLYEYHDAYVYSGSRRAWNHGRYRNLERILQCLHVRAFKGHDRRWIAYTFVEYSRRISEVVCRDVYFSPAHRRRVLLLPKNDYGKRVFRRH